jgi:hypothetical protein
MLMLAYKRCLLNCIDCYLPDAFAFIRGGRGYAGTNWLHTARVGWEWFYVESSGLYRLSQIETNHPCWLLEYTSELHGTVL